MDTKSKFPEMNSGLYMHMLGVYRLLGECAVYVPEDVRECMERALDDAKKLGFPIRVCRILNRINVEIDSRGGGAS